MSGQMSHENIAGETEMSIMTIELPNVLVEAIHDQDVSLEEIQPVIVKAVEDWLQNRPNRKTGAAENVRSSRFEEDATRFANKLIAQNRELFEQLAAL